MVHDCVSIATKPSSISDNDPRPGLGVLVVEDHPQLRHSLCEGLQACGWKVWAAKDGRVAVDLYSRVRDSIDIVLCDVQMPQLDGPQTLEALQAINLDVKFCFMTGDASSQMLDRLLGRGALCIFIKPFRVKDIASRLQAATRRRPRRPVQVPAPQPLEESPGIAEWLWLALRGWFR